MNSPFLYEDAAEVIKDLKSAVLGALSSQPVRMLDERLVIALPLSLPKGLTRSKLRNTLISPSKVLDLRELEAHQKRRSRVDVKEAVDEGACLGVKRLYDSR